MSSQRVGCSKNSIHGRALGLTAAIVAFAITAGPASAAPGDLDGSFASGGRLIGASSPLSDTAAEAVATQPDGKIVTVGGDEPVFAKGMTVARFNPDGTPDRSFDGDGVKVVRYGGAKDGSNAFAVAIDGRGRIVIGGTWSKQTEPGGAEKEPEFRDFWALTRLTRSGELDRSFSRDGKVVMRSESGIYALALASGGRIVAVGSGFNVARYRSDGRLDRSFSRDGRRTVRFRKGGDQQASAVSLTSRGRIVVAGKATGRGSAALDHYALARLKPSGSLDRRFGRAGRIFGRSAGGGIRDMELDPRARIVAVGERNFGGETEIKVSRYTSRGRLDRAFGQGGLAGTRFRSNAYAGGIALAGDGKVVVGGNVLVPVEEEGGSSSSPNFLVARFTAGGALDRSFSGDGVQTTQMGSRVYDSGGNDVALQRDGKIVVAGYAGQDGGTVLARYLAR